MVISGAGAAGSATARLLLEEGFSPERPVLAFPGAFRGLLDGGSRWMTARVQLAAAEALTHLLDEELRADVIMPSIFDERVVPRVAEAVSAASPWDRCGYLISGWYVRRAFVSHVDDEAPA